MHVNPAGPFPVRLKSGRPIEQRILEFYRDRGWQIIDLTRHADRGAPRTIGSPPIILPDLLVAKDGRSFFLEIKSKAAPARYDNEWRIGVDQPLWEDYLEIERRFGIPIRLIVYLRDPGEVRGGLVSKLRAYPQESDRYGRNGIPNVFIPVNAMTVYDIPLFH